MSCHQFVWSSLLKELWAGKNDTDTNKRQQGIIASPYNVRWNKCNTSRTQGDMVPIWKRSCHPKYKTRVRQQNKHNTDKIWHRMNTEASHTTGAMIRATWHGINGIKGTTSHSALHDNVCNNLPSNYMHLTACLEQGYWKREWEGSLENLMIE